MTLFQKHDFIEQWFHICNQVCGDKDKCIFFVVADNSAENEITRSRINTCNRFIQNVNLSLTAHGEDELNLFAVSFGKPLEQHTFIDSQRVKKAADLLGLLNVVFFSPEDLSIIKNSPAERRRFMDMELCQLDSFYLYNLSHYNQILNQRNKLLKEMAKTPELAETLAIWDSQLASYGSKIIERREGFVEQLNEIINRIHYKLSGEKEDLKLIYEKNSGAAELEEKIRQNRNKDIYLKQTTAGPHRDDLSFMVNGIDIRKFGSQGQQRTAALSLKLSEIEIVKKSIHDTPVLLLDDVLSELDSNRQNFLLSEIKDIQTLITCTGLDEFVKNRFEINKVFKVTYGSVKEMSKEDIEV